MGEDGVYTAFPSEGGHSEFAPKTALAWECVSRNLWVLCGSLICSARWYWGGTRVVLGWH